MMDFRQYSIESMPPEDRAEALRLKAQALHEVACRIQDELNRSGIFLGDSPLIEAKQAIDKACTKARTVADKVGHARRPGA